MLRSSGCTGLARYLSQCRRRHASVPSSPPVTRPKSLPRLLARSRASPRRGSTYRPRERRPGPGMRAMDGRKAPAKRHGPGLWVERVHHPQALSVRWRRHDHRQTLPMRAGSPGAASRHLRGVRSPRFSRAPEESARGLWALPERGAQHPGVRKRRSPRAPPRTSHAWPPWPANEPATGRLSSLAEWYNQSYAPVGG